MARQAEAYRTTVELFLLRWVACWESYAHYQQPDISRWCQGSHLKHLADVCTRQTSLNNWTKRGREINSHQSSSEIIAAASRYGRLRRGWVFGV